MTGHIFQTVRNQIYHTLSLSVFSIKEEILIGNRNRFYILDLPFNVIKIFYDPVFPDQLFWIHLNPGFDL